MHPSIVDLGSDNDSIATMDEARVGPSTSRQEPTFRRSEIAIGESSSMAPNSHPEPIFERDDHVEHSGIWLPLDYKSGPKLVTICNRWLEHALSFDYYRVAEELY